MSETCEFNSNKLNDLLRDVSEECIAYATKELEKRGISKDPIIISLHAYTVFMNWHISVTAQIMGECQQMQQKFNEGLDK